MIEQLKEKRSELQNIQKKAEQAKAEKYVLLKQLKEEFEVKSLKEAEEMLEVLTDELYNTKKEISSLTEKMDSIIAKAKEAEA